MHQVPSPFVLPQQYPQPLIPQQFPAPVHHSIPYGFGYMGNAPNSGPKPPFMQKPNYKGNSGYKSNTGFKGKGYNTGSSSGYSSSTSRQYGSSGWHGNTENRSTTVIECQICNKRGHTAVNCFHRNGQGPSTGFHMECQICGRRGHSALDCYHRGNYVFQGQQPSSTLTAMAAQQTEQHIPQDAWIVDTGASHHITADVNTPSQVTPFQGQEDKGHPVQRKE
ncbi:unnamed protein product [Malus baccata var. baccata]